jgi:4-amino-4-deoxy-L-arabinose transferase-like glycosyltransferase
MIESPHLDPLRSGTWRDGSIRSGDCQRSTKAHCGPNPSNRRPFVAAQRNFPAKLIIVLWVLAIAVRLVLISQPYVDHWSWRESDVAAIARNFFENGFCFAYPQIDWAGGSAGYVGTEFPILPFLAAICYKFAGIHEWIGRSQSVLFFAVSFPFFFLLVREIFGGTAAIWATFFYAFAPLNVFAGRSFIPDVPSLSLAIIGLYFFLRWVRTPKPASFYLSAIAISSSILIKATSIVVFAPLACMLVERRMPRGTPGVPQKRPTIYRMVAFAAIALVPSIAWYWHSRQIAQTYYPHHFFGAGGVRLESLSWYWDITRQTATSSLTPVLTVLALIGLFVPPRGKFGGLFDWWLAGMVLFVIAVGYGNRHPWYQLPFVPIAAAFAGAACAFVGSKISSRVTTVTLSILLATLFAILAFFYVGPLYESSAAQQRNAGLELNKITPSDALIVAVDNGNPAIFYYAKRKGWHFLEQDGIYGGNPKDGRQAIVDLERLRREGATHLVFVTNMSWWLNSYPELTQHLSETATLVEVTPQFRIYKLKTAAR